QAAASLRDLAQLLPGSTMGDGRDFQAAAHRDVVKGPRHRLHARREAVLRRSLARLRLGCRAALPLASMERSTRRILTTHTGSLPRPDDLLETMRAHEDGRPVDQANFDARVKQAVAENVK